ncbi:MAG TPA: MBL fold metallo-hydrolase [Gemmatimonadales bacterium]|nr:MBL fold metallo-hydrolase [Gemmatimonadales bacterium]
MNLLYSFSVGGLKCHALEGGLQRLDGGAMFGVVPKPLWQRRIAPDERNRIPLGLRCLLVEHPVGLVLIDSGIGNKEDTKFREIYGVENQGKQGATQLEDAMLAAGYRPEDVELVINTHLHFDHAGGNTRTGGQAGGRAGGQDETSSEPSPSDRQTVRPTFANATYVVQKAELEFARHTNERTRASYLPHNFEPIAAAGKWRLVEGEGEIVPGISARLTPGHVPWHQSIVVHDRGETAVFLGDVTPTSAHLPLPWIMGYDLEPLRTLESKRALLGEAAANGWLLIFEHDPEVIMGRAARGGRETELIEPVKVTRA